MSNVSSNVGARLLLIGKDGVLVGLREITAATARLNAEIAAGAKSSQVAAAGYAEQEAGLARLGGQMNAYEANLARNAAATDAMATLGRRAFIGLGAATAVWTYESIKWARSYQTELLKLRTQAGLTVGAMNQISAAAMRNAATLGISPTEYVTAVYHPASAQLGTARSIAITNVAAKQAAISGASVEDTVNSLTGLVMAYKIPKSRIDQTQAVLNAIVGSGNMRFSDLNSAIATGMFATAKTFGLSIPSVGSALAYQTDTGIPAARAGTNLRMAISLLGAPSAEATKFLQIAGLSKTQAQDATSAIAQTLKAAGLSTTAVSSALRDNSGGGGIYNALNLIHSRLDASGMSPEMQAAFISRSFGGGRMGTTIESLYQNLPRLKQKNLQIERQGTTARFNQDWAQTTQTLGFQGKRALGELETMGTQFGLKVIPPLTEAVKIFGNLLDVMDKNKWMVIALGGALTAILIPAMGVYLVRAFLGGGGAIRTVLTGYRNLLLGQSAEKASLMELDGTLTTTSGATYRLVAANDALAGSERTAGLAGDAEAAGTSAAGRGGFLGLGKGVVGKAAGGLAVAAAGYTAYQMTSQYLNSTKQRGLGHDVIAGASRIADWFGVGPDQVAAAHAKALLSPTTIQFLDKLATGTETDRKISAKDAAAQLMQIGNPTRLGQTPVQVHVYLDGKEITKTVYKHTKAKAARS
jgi:TP901 family phage tail tape measure protein